MITARDQIALTMMKRKPPDYAANYDALQKRMLGSPEFFDINSFKEGENIPSLEREPGQVQEHIAQETSDDLSDDDLTVSGSPYELIGRRRR